MEYYAATNSEPLHTNKILSPYAEDWDSEYRYIIMRPFAYIGDAGKAFEVQNKKEAEIEEIRILVMRTIKEFRGLIRKNYTS